MKSQVQAHRHTCQHDGLLAWRPDSRRAMQQDCLLACKMASRPAWMLACKMDGLPPNALACHHTCTLACWVSREPSRWTASHQACMTTSQPDGMRANFQACKMTLVVLLVGA